MADDSITEYEEAISRARDKGMIADGDEDRRSHPRLIAGGASLQVAFDATTEISDISASGVSFLSDEEYRDNQRIQIAVGEYFGVPALVMGCETLPQKKKSDPVRYQIRCRFQDEYLGRFAVVQLLGQQLE